MEESFRGLNECACRPLLGDIVEWCRTGLRHCRNGRCVPQLPLLSVMARLVPDLVSHQFDKRIVGCHDGVAPRTDRLGRNSFSH